MFAIWIFLPRMFFAKWFLCRELLSFEWFTVVPFVSFFRNFIFSNNSFPSKLHFKTYLIFSYRVIFRKNNFLSNIIFPSILFLFSQHSPLDIIFPLQNYFNTVYYLLFYLKSLSVSKYILCRVFSGCKYVLSIVSFPRPPSVFLSEYFLL